MNFRDIMAISGAKFARATIAGDAGVASRFPEIPPVGGVVTNVPYRKSGCCELSLHQFFNSYSKLSSYHRLPLLRLLKLPVREDPNSNG